MIRFRTIFLLTLVLFMAAVFSASAAKVKLANGKTLSGEIVSEDEDSIRLKVGGITVLLFRSEIVSILDDEGNVRKIEVEPEEIPPEIGEAAVPGATEEVQQEEPPEGEEEGEPSSLQTVEQANPVLPVVLPKGKTHTITARMLNVRKGPSTDFDKISALPEGSVVVEFQKQDDWIRIRLPDGSMGWVHGNYTRALEDSPVVCTGERVNFRENAGTNYKILRKLREQEVLLMLQKKGDWVQLRDSENTIGWAHRNFIAKLVDPTALHPDFELRSDAKYSPLNEEVSKPSRGGGGEVVQLTVLDPDFVRGGKVSLIFMAPNSQAEIWESLIQSKDTVSKHTFYGEEEVQRLGLGAGVSSGAGAAQRVILKGFLEEGNWIFEYRTSGLQVPQVRRMIVGQSGRQRGILFEF